MPKYASTKTTTSRANAHANQAVHNQIKKEQHVPPNKSAALKVPILPGESPLAPQPDGLLLPLHPHQLRALHRCLLIESDHGEGSLSSDFGARHDYKSRGGVLADAVGTGKTATSIGLILAGDEGNGGDTLIVAPGHLIPQWKEEILKFAGTYRGDGSGKGDAKTSCDGGASSSDDGKDHFCSRIQVIVGKAEYDAHAFLPVPITKRRIVLIDVDTILNEKKLWYNFRRVFSSPTGYRIQASRQDIEKYKKAALFCVQSPRGPCSYDGWVYTGTLHYPHRPWRRVIFDEIQDLVAEGTESQKNLLQLSRTAEHVWLLSATPFPHGNRSVYANHELLGFCRLRLDVESDDALPNNHPFEIIKRKLYIRSPRHIADEAVRATRDVTRHVELITPTALESNFYDLEMRDLLGSSDNDEECNKFGAKYDSLRQMMVHPEASEKLREVVTTQNCFGGATATVPVGRYSSVQSFAKSTLSNTKARLHEVERHELPSNRKFITSIMMSLNLARKVRIERERARQSNPFASASTYEVDVITDEAKAIQSFYTIDSRVHFRTIVNENFPGPEIIRGRNAIQNVTRYFNTQLHPDRDVHGEKALDSYIRYKELEQKNESEKNAKLEAEVTSLKARIEALSSTIQATNKRNSDASDEDRQFSATYGAKPATLMKYLQLVIENKEQAIVFSYWHDTLKLVRRTLNRCGLRTAFCDGNSKEMSKSLSDFTSGTVSILLLSAQAKASGANLQCATHVILLDPAGSSAEHGATLEKQAIGRAVRMGQTKPVTVIRFCVKDSIEESLFDEINDATEKAERRSDDSTYVCENANKEIKINLKKQRSSEDDILVTESTTVEERVSRQIALAKKKGAVIEILDDDDDDDDDDEKDEIEQKSKAHKSLSSSIEASVGTTPKVKLEKNIFGNKKRSASSEDGPLSGKGQQHYDDERANATISVGMIPGMSTPPPSNKIARHVSPSCKHVKTLDC